MKRSLLPVNRITAFLLLLAIFFSPVLVAQNKTQVKKHTTSVTKSKRGTAVKKKTTKKKRTKRKVKRKRVIVIKHRSDNDEQLQKIKAEKNKVKKK